MALRPRRSRNGGRGLPDRKGKVDFGILTIRKDEFEAVLERFPAFETVPGRRVYNLHRLELPGGGSYLVAVVRCIEQGNTEALDAARDILEELDPRWLLVVGIAGAVPSDDFGLGDVVVSTRVHDFSVEAVLQNKESEYAMMGGPVHKDAATVIANLGAQKAKLQGWNTASSIIAHRPPIELDDELFYGGEEWQKKARKALACHETRTEPLFMDGAIGSSDRLRNRPSQGNSPSARRRDGIGRRVPGCLRSAGAGRGDSRDQRRRRVQAGSGVDGLCLPLRCGLRPCVSADKTD